jgi:hypothetical protein
VVYCSVSGKEDPEKEPLSGLQLLPILQQDTMQHVPSERLLKQKEEGQGGKGAQAALQALLSMTFGRRRSSHTIRGKIPEGVCFVKLSKAILSQL